MKRDLDLCRELMLEFEAAPPGTFIQSVDLKNREECDSATVFAHIDLLIGAGYLVGKAVVDPNQTHSAFFVTKITWEGHDFIDCARNDTVWSKTKDRLKQAGAWTFSLALEILKDEAKKQFGTLLI